MTSPRSNNGSMGSMMLEDLTERQVMCRCSEISEKIQKSKIEQDKPIKFQELLFEEIFSLQQHVERCRLFKTGQELYTKWLEQVLNVNGSINRIEEGSFGINNELVRMISRAFNNRGYLKYLQVDFEGAIQDYTKALKYDSSLACAFYNRGLVTYRLAFFQQSIEDLKEAVRLDPCEEFKFGLQRSEEAFRTSTGHSINLEDV